MIRRHIYPLPRIQDILRSRNGYEFFTKLDISMQYYTFELDDHSKNLCVISTPFGLFRYCRLPMGIKQSSDIAQSTMESLFRHISDVNIYIDDVGCFSRGFEQHLTLLDHVLDILQTNGFTVNPSKCEWAVKETDWLGHWLTPEGIKPWSKKIKAILNMSAPTDLKQLRSFLGAVNYYRDMWPHRSHILAPLTDLTGKRRFQWTPLHQRAFDAMKALITEDALLHYPDHNLPFHIYTDASDYQLGSVIIQTNHPVAYYSRKLTPTQRNYTTIEKELLSIAETLKEFRTMLLGASLHIYTDHRNLTHHHFTTQRVLRWRLYVEEFHPTFHYVKGADNTLADSLSRLPQHDSSGGAPLPQAITNPIVINSTPEPHEIITPSITTAFALEIDDESLLNCFLYHPDLGGNVYFPVDYEIIQQHQNRDVNLQEQTRIDPNRYHPQPFGNINLICYNNTPTEPWRIVIPNTLIDMVIDWYHQILSHVGMTRLYETIKLHFFHPSLKLRVEAIVRKCDTCQRSKTPGAGYGELPPRETLLAPWYEVAVDLIGPWKIKVGHQELVFQALTCIDTVTNLAEVIRIENKTSSHVAMKFENEWLACYPRPLRCIHDGGAEFVGAAFAHTLFVNGIRNITTTVKNPQANAVCERLHQTISNSLRAHLQQNPPNREIQANDIIDTCFATASYASRAAIHRTLKISPGALVFHRDMILDIPLLANLHDIQQRRQLIIDDRLRRANLKRRSFDYQVGQQVLLLADNPDKLQDRASGPFPITQVHANGTITIQRTPYYRE
jgi:transposase InsO family protein